MFFEENFQEIVSRPIFREKRVSRKSRSNYEGFARGGVRFAVSSRFQATSWTYVNPVYRYAISLAARRKEISGIEGCFPVRARESIASVWPGQWSFRVLMARLFARGEVEDESKNSCTRVTREGRIVLEEDGTRAVIGIPHKLCLGVSEFMRKLLSSTDVRVIVKTPSLYYSACYTTVNNFDRSCKHYTTEIWIPFWWISLNFNPIVKNW